jgi:DNA-binding NarL/FixJ family response regulator
MWLGELEVTEGELAQATWHQSLARKVAAYLRSDFLLDAVIRLERMIERTAKDRAAGGAAEPDLPLTQLSQRELDVARLVGAGQTNQQIARNLGLSHKTVETYLTRIFKKLGASSRSQVAAEIGRAG